MNDVKKNYNVTIFGASYVLCSSEPDEFIQQSAHLVDTLMHEISQQMGTNRDVRQIMLLTALRLANRVVLLEKTIAQAEKLEQKILEKMEQVSF